MDDILLVAAVLPVILLCNYIYKKDTHKEPSSLLGQLFGMGVISALPVIIVELFLDNFFSTDDVTNFFLIFINTFIGVALVEEGFKWIFTKKYGYDNNEFDEVYDIIVYSVFVSLGFACIENIFYVFSYGLGNALLRAVLSVPGHACFAVLMGYFFSKAKINQISGNKDLYKKNMFYSILVPALFHTMYDGLLFYASAIESTLFVIIFLVFDVFMVVMCFKVVNKTSKMQQNLNTNLENGTIVNSGTGTIAYQVPGDTETHFCPICGRNVDGMNFCPSCGFKLH